MNSPHRFNAAHERSLGFALSDLVRLIRRDFLARAKEYHLTPELWRLLYCLDRDEGCTQAHLAEVLDVTPVTLGRMVDALEERGFVKRGADPADRRATRLLLTRQAAAPIARMHELVDDTRRQAMRGLAVADQDRFWVTLARIRENLSASGKKAPRARRAAGGSSHVR